MLVQKPSRLGNVAVGAGYLLFFLLLTAFSSLFRIEQDTLLWYGPAGLDIALLWGFGVGFAPVVFAAHFLGRLLIMYPAGPLLPLAVADLLITAVEATSVGWLQRMFPRDWRRWTLAQYIDFSLVMLAVSLATAGLRIVDFTLFGITPWSRFPHLLYHGCLANYLGIMNIAAVLMVNILPWIGEHRARAWPPRLSVLAEAMLIPLVLWSCLVAQQAAKTEFLYLCYVPLILIALRHGLGGAAPASLAINLGVIALVTVLFPADIPSLQVFLFVLTLTGLFLGILNSERLAAMAALRENEQKYRQLVELSPDAIVVHQEGKLVFANSAAFAMMGAGRPEDLLGKAVIDFVHPQYAKLAQERMKLMMQGEKASLTDEKFVLPGGRVIDVEVAGTSILYNGRPGIQLVIRDITSRKRMEEALRHAEDVLRRDNESLERIVAERSQRLIETQQALEKSRRLSEIGALSAMVAHELRNPLGVIRLALYSLKTRNAPEQAGPLERIERKLAESEQIIANLLSYSRIKEPRLQKAALGDSIQECLELARAKAAKKKVEITARVEPIQELVFEVDPLQFREVLNNVLDNAIHAAPAESGRILVSARPGRPGCMELLVSDNGPGIPADELEKVFEPFFTKKAQGTGLGLAISRELMHLQRGDIVLESPPGQGVTAHLILPREAGVSCAGQREGAGVGSGGVSVGGSSK